MASKPTLNIYSVADAETIIDICRTAEFADIGGLVAECEFNDRTWASIDKRCNLFIARIADNGALTVTIDRTCYSTNPRGDYGQLKIIKM